jgi:hypothetical protein
MSSGAQIGFHAAFDATSGQESGVGNALVGAYLSRIGLPYSAVIYITQATPSAMTWLNLKDAERQGIDVSALELSRREYSPAPSPPRNPLSETDLQRRASNFVVGVVEQWSGPSNLALRFLSGIYAPQVDFYGSSITRDAVIDIKRKFGERWPERNYVVRQETINTQCDSTTMSCEVRGVLDWTTSSQQRQAKSIGSARFMYRVGLVNQAFEILSESGQVLSRQLTGKK